jgi:hypothetical protein
MTARERAGQSDEIQEALDIQKRADGYYYIMGKSRDSAIAFMNSAARSEEDVKAYAERLTASWNALQGIPTEAINSSLIEDIVEAVKIGKVFGEALKKTDPDWNGMDDIRLFNLNEILFRIQEATSPAQEVGK